MCGVLVGGIYSVSKLKNCKMQHLLLFFFPAG